MLRRLLSNKKVLFTIIGFLPLTVSVVFTPVYVNYLSLKDYGFLNFYNTFLGIIAPVLHIGIKDGYGFLYWKNTESREQTDQFFNKSFSTMLVFQVLTMGVFLLLGAKVLPVLFTAWAQPEYTPYIWVAAFYAFFLNFNELFFYYYRNTGNMKRFVQLNVASLLLMTVGSFLGIFVFKMGLYGAIMGKFAGYGLVVLYFFIRQIRFMDWKPGKVFVRQIISSGFPILMGSVLGAYSSVCDKYFLQEYFSISTLGVYGMALTIVYLIEILLTSFMHQMLPATLLKIRENASVAVIVPPIQEVFHLMTLFGFGVLAATPVVLGVFPKDYQEVMIYVPYLMLIPFIKFLYNFNVLNFYLFSASRIFLKAQIVSSVCTFLITFLMPPATLLFGAVFIALCYNMLQLVVSYLFLLRERYFLLNDKALWFFLGLAVGLLIIVGFIYQATSYSALFFIPFFIYSMVALKADAAFFSKVKQGLRSVGR